MSEEANITFIDLGKMKTIEQVKIDRYGPANTYKVDIIWDGYNTVYRVYVWAHDGGTSLLTEEFKDLDTARQSARDAIEKFQSDGQLRCADCDRQISYKDNENHRYFAGIYCEHCWINKWKEVADNERY